MDITVWKYQPEHFLSVWEGLSALREEMLKSACQKMAKEYGVRFFAYHDHAMVIDRGSVMDDRLKMAKAESIKGVMDWQHKLLPKIEVFLPIDWSAIFCMGLGSYQSCEKLMSDQLWWSKVEEPTASNVLNYLGGADSLNTAWSLKWVNPSELFVPEDWMNYSPSVTERAEHLAHALLHQASGKTITQEDFTKHPQFIKLVDKMTKIMHRHDEELQTKINQMWPNKKYGIKVAVK